MRMRKFHPVVLFPAHAGVIPVGNHDTGEYSTFPRTRGGDPVIVNKHADAVDFSPHTRG